MNDHEKTILLCISIFFLVFLLTPEISSHYDYIFHYEKSIDVNACPFPYYLSNSVTPKINCENYPPLMHLISHPFAFSEVTYFYYLLFLNLLLIPFLLFYFTKTWKTALFYFSSYLWTQGAIYGTLGQTGAIILFILFYFQKNKLVRLFLIVISLFVHKLALWLLLLLWLSEILRTPIIKLFKIFGESLKKIGSKIAIMTPSFPRIGFAEITPLMITFFRQTNLVSVFHGLKQIVKDKNFYLFIPILASFVMAFGSIDRALWVLQIIFCIEASKQKMGVIEFAYSFIFIIYVFIKMFFAIGLLSKIATVVIALFGFYVIFYNFKHGYTKLKTKEGW